jgi:hypothetical protein
MNLITLDYVNDIVLVPEFSTIKNCHALNNLKVGLWSLASTVRLEEVRKFTSPVKFAINFDGRDDLIACYFHWFATSLVNYVRLVGFIDFLNKKRWAVESLQDRERKSQVKVSCKSYIDGISEVQRVLKWRNKIAAHFAATDPWEQDNISTLQDSIQHPITYSRPYYYANLHVFGLGEGESAIPEWSLTETFESLSSRYWPDCKLQQFAE